MIIGEGALELIVKYKLKTKSMTQHLKMCRNDKSTSSGQLKLSDD